VEHLQDTLAVVAAVRMALVAEQELQRKVEVLEFRLETEIVEQQTLEAVVVVQVQPQRQQVATAAQV
jgi:hypothetical protein